MAFGAKSRRAPVGGLAAVQQNHSSLLKEPAMSVTSAYPYAGATAMVAPVDPDWEKKVAAKNKQLRDGPRDGSVQVFVEKAEWYPVFMLKDVQDASDYVIGWSPLREVGVETLARWCAAFGAFKAVQDEIRALLGEED